MLKIDYFLLILKHVKHKVYIHYISRVSTCPKYPLYYLGINSMVQMILNDYSLYDQLKSITKGNFFHDFIDDSLIS